jgi:hypothetical protein
MSPEGGRKSSSVASQETVDLAKFLFLANEKKCDITTVTRMATIRKYLNKLRQCGVGPSGQLTKLTILKHALTMVVIHIPDDDAPADTANLASSIATVQVKIAGIMKSLRKECTSIRKRKRDMFDTTSLDHCKVLSFVRDTKLLALIQSWVQKDTLTEQELLTLRRYLMCRLVYENAQRQGAVVNMKLEEQAQATLHTTSTGKKVYMYKVWEHKTSGQFGSAHIVTPEDVHDILCTYVKKYRPQPLPECSDYVFLTPAGHRVTHLSDDLRLLSNTIHTEHGELVCTATQMRKLTATQIAQESTDESTVRTVATHMTHSTDVAKSYYQQLQSSSASAKAFEIITEQQTDMVLSKEPVLKVKKVKRMWLKEEEDVLRATFSLTAESNPPKLDECDAFLTAASHPHLFVGHTMEVVECRTIIRQLKD